MALTITGETDWFGLKKIWKESLRISNEVELINMGILKEFRGLKLGSMLLNHAIASASRKNPKRMWVHTCSLDHKHALQNYKSKGFEIYKEEEIDFVA